MVEGKKKKILRYTLIGFYFVLCSVIPIVVLWLPGKYGVEWIAGWPSFFSYLLIWLPAIVMFMRLLLKVLKQPFNEKFNRKKKMLAVLLYVLINVFYIGISAFLGFVNQWRKADRYIVSPNGKNKAIVMVDKDEEWKTEYVCPVRAWIFFEDDQCIYLHPEWEDITYTWVDDNTLEVKRIREASEDNEEEVEIEYLHW